SSGPIAAGSRPKPGGQLLVGASDPIAQDRARAARVDDFLDAKSLRGPERRAQALELLLYLAAMRSWIGRCFDLSPVSSLHAALYRKGAPITGWPGIAQVELLCVSVASSSYTEHAPDYNRNPRDRGLIHCRKRPRPDPYSPHLLGGSSNK